MEITMGKIAALHIHEEDNENNMAQDDVRTLRQQLDRILYLLEGEEDIPGVVKRVATLEELLMGRRGNDGMVHQVRTMWRVHIWILCSLSGGLGYLLRELIVKMFH